MRRAALTPEASISEKDWQQMVVDYARWNQWLVYHPLHSIGSEAGWPDLVLCHPATAAIPAQLVFAELKSEAGKVSAPQARWIAALKQAGQEVTVWRPSDWPTVERRLKRVRRRAAS